MLENKLCECGCGGYTGPGKRFINGHGRRGKKHSEKTKLKMRKSHLGVKLSKKIKIKMSKSKLGKNHPMYGKHHSEKTLEKMSVVKLGKKHTEKTKQKIKINHADFSGKNHPNWQNGISFFLYPLGWTETLRESIRQRDSYICQLCGKTHKENGRKLSIHHIDYNKNNLDPKNLITLCNSCNARVNYDRDYWMKFFNKRQNLDMN